MLKNMLFCSGRYSKHLKHARNVGIKKGLLSSIAVGSIYFFVFGTYALGFWWVHTSLTFISSSLSSFISCHDILFVQVRLNLDCKLWTGSWRCCNCEFSYFLLPFPSLFLPHSFFLTLSSSLFPSPSLSPSLPPLPPLPSSLPPSFPPSITYTCS